MFDRTGALSLASIVKLLSPAVPALSECGDLIDPIAIGLIEAHGVITMVALLGDPIRRRSGTDLTLFNSVGTALAGLIAAELLLYRLAGDHKLA